MTKVVSPTEQAERAHVERPARELECAGRAGASLSDAMPDGAFRRLDTRYGSLLVPAGDEVVGRFLARYGEWAWLEASFVAGLLEERARVLDGGAFLGTFGLGVSLRRPGASVVYVEANPAVCEALRCNVGSWPKAGSMVVSAMIGDGEATLRAGRHEPGNLGSTSYRRESLLACGVEPAEAATTLLALREAHGPFDLVKLDLEGMEAEALAGDAAFLSTGRTTLVLECNEDERSLQVARMLLDWDLPLYYFAFPSFNPRNFNGDPAPVYPMAYEAGLLAAPRHKPVLSEALVAARCILKPIRSIHDLRVALWRTPRWGMADWDEATQPELAALAGRVLRSESFDGFLCGGDRADAAAASGAPTSKAVDDLRALLETERAERALVDAGLRDASALAIARLGELAQERELRASVEAGLQEASALALARLDELARERELRASVEAGLQEASALALARLDELAEERRLRAAVDAGLREASALAIARLAALTEEREWRAAAEAGRASAEAQALALQGDWTEERKRRQAAEAELARTSAQALSHLAAAGAARDRAERAEAAAGAIPELGRTLALLRSSEAGLVNALEAAEQTRQWAEDRAAIAERRATIADGALDVFRASTVWRMSAPVRALFGLSPSMRSAARGGRLLLGRIVRTARR